MKNVVLSNEFEAEDCEDKRSREDGSTLNSMALYGILDVAERIAKLPKRKQMLKMLEESELNYGGLFA